MSGRRGIGWTAAAVLLASALFAIAPLADAGLAGAKPGSAAGALDRSFGEGGRIATALPADLSVRPPKTSREPWSLEGGEGPHPRATTAVAVGPDGSTVVGIGRAIVRYGPDGELEREFGHGGVLALRPVEGLTFELSDVAVDGAGDVLAFGSAVDRSTTMTGSNYCGSYSTHPSFSAVLRFDAAGAPDPTFGGGDGVFRVDLGQRSWLFEGAYPLSGVSGGQLDDEGRAVVTVQQLDYPPAIGHTCLRWNTHTVARLTPGGQLDSSFGQGGTVDMESDQSGPFTDVGVDGTDRLLVSRYKVGVDPAGRFTGVVQRLQEDGSPDPSFGEAGVAYASRGAESLATDGSGRVVVLQRRETFPCLHREPSCDQLRGKVRWPLVRLTAAGTVDRSFGLNGRAWVTLPGHGSTISSLAVDARGRVLVAGTLRVGGPDGHRQRSYFTVIRLLANGRPDPSFGHGGWVRTGFGRHTTVAAEGVALLPRDRLLVAGYGRSPELQPGGVVAARYLLGR